MELTELLNKSVPYYKMVSETLYVFGMDEKHLYGHVSIHKNNIICRFHYKIPSGMYAKNFIYNKKLFDDELDKATKAYIDNYNNYIETVLSHI